MIERRTFITGLMAGASLLLLPGGLALADNATVTVYKSPTCGCCGAWVEHLRAHGFSVIEQNRDDMSIVKSRLGVPQDLWSCHTATVGDYVVEGHVPAEDLARLLAEAPDGVAGISVPGMPAGSPGMEVEGFSQPYTVWAFGEGEHSEFARHGET